ncbi:MAG: ABC transporter permease [Tannerellaceae bacterium]|jgi:putative ABC transport system permease protein|nr:ABC transporter permease [Tannerellaceae bacterium]
MNFIKRFGEVLHEVYSSIKQHKARSILTGFNITWGIFILIVLLGAGNGFRNGTLSVFSGYASNSIWVTGRRVSIATSSGLQTGSQIRFNDELLNRLKRRFAGIRQIASEVSLPNNNPIVYKDNTGWFNLKGISEDYLIMKSLEVREGRFLNPIDYREQRRSIIISEYVRDILFDKEYPIGKYIHIEGVMFCVVGVLKSGTLSSIMEQNNIYVPSSALLTTFNPERNYATFGAILHDNTTIETFEGELRNYLAQEIGFSNDDKSALLVTNIQLQVKAFNMLFDGVDTFLWILGLCFILSGMIGIMNIMLVVVKERTQEIGVRKALGATPASIYELIIIEALLITIIFGIVGMFLGFAGLGVYNWVVSALQSNEEQIFAKAAIDFYIVLFSFIMLVLAGVIAGLFPAKKAASVMPAETLSKVM